MAESRYKIKAYGAPFELRYSSCSNITPTNFDWCSTNSDIEVWIDEALMYQPNSVIPKEKRFGWLCESSVIQQKVYDVLYKHHNKLFDNYYNKIFTCDFRLISLNSNFKYVPAGSNYPWIPKSEWNICAKNKLCSITASPKTWTEGHRYRHDIAFLAKQLGFDLFGGAYGSKRTIKGDIFGSITSPWNTKSEHIKDYMFHIVIENHLNDAYYTEKLMDCFALGAVPIYWGTKNIPSFFKESGILRLEQGNEHTLLQALSKDLYNSMKPSIQHNFNALNKLKIADDYLYEEIIKCIS